MSEGQKSKKTYPSQSAHVCQSILLRIRSTSRDWRTTASTNEETSVEYHKRRFRSIQTGAHQETSSNTLFLRSRREDLYQVLYILSRNRRHHRHTHNFSQTFSSWFFLFSAFNHQKSMGMRVLLRLCDCGTTVT